VPEPVVNKNDIAVEQQITMDWIQLDK
jgi:hypothetical protein